MGDINLQLYDKLRADYSANPENDAAIKQFRDYGQQASQSAQQKASAGLAQRGFGQSTFVPTIQQQAGSIAQQPFAQAETDYLTQAKNRELQAGMAGINASLQQSQLGQQANQFNRTLSQQESEFSRTMEQENKQWADKLGVDTRQFNELVRQFDITNQTQINQFADQLGLDRDKFTEAVRNNKALEALQGRQLSNQEAQLAWEKKKYDAELRRQDQGGGLNTLMGIGGLLSAPFTGGTSLLGAGINGISSLFGNNNQSKNTNPNQYTMNDNNWFN